MDKNLKAVSREAKNRFKNGYWANFNKLREEEISKAKLKGDDVENVKKTFSRIAVSEIKVQTGTETEEDKLYKKVCQLLSSDEIVLNPISRLIDEAKYKLLNEEEKQRYVSNLSNLYQKLRERYYSEQQCI